MLRTGDSGTSELVRRITATNNALRMPPVYSGLKLTEREIDTLRTWVAEGAKWEKHWSFIPPRRRPLPQVANQRWPRNAIDSFILARLEKEGLKPAEEADKETLLRRVTLDLTGLPPTPAETEAFLRRHVSEGVRNGGRPLARVAALRRAHGRALAGCGPLRRHERLSDMTGERIMWRWRDWVIDAFNRNQPFDQFTLEQIAGDMLPNATLEQKIATGFNRNHREQFGRRHRRRGIRAWSTWWIAWRRRPRCFWA